MKVTSDMVKELQSRIEVTYEEAEKVLLRTNGGLDRAEHILYRKKNSTFSRFSEEAGRIYHESLTYYFKITRGQKIVMDMPLLIIVGLFLIMNADAKIWVGIVTVGIILLSESSVTIYRVKKDQASETVHKDEEAEAPVKDETETEGTDKDMKDDDDDDFYEITIKK